MPDRPVKEMKKPEVKKPREYPKYSETILPQLTPTLERFANGPLQEYLPGVEKTITLFLDRFLPIPRPTSKKGSMEGAMTQELCDIASEHTLHAEVDKADNIGIVIPATKGYEHIGVIMAQAHKDIVPAKGDNAKTDPADGYIEPVVVDIDGKQWLKAKDDTTLGADDGTGFASLLQAAIDLDASGQPHGPILVLGTSREESGLLGAKEMAFPEDSEVGKLLPEVKYILNSDGEERAKITVGSIGGEMMHVTRPVTFEPLSDEQDVVSLRVSNLRGGHSGAYADRAGGISVLADWLSESAVPVQLVALSTSNKFDNSIPQDATAIIAVGKSDKQALLKTLTERIPTLTQSYTDEQIDFALEDAPQRPSRVMNRDSSEASLTLLKELGTLHGMDGSSEVFGTQLLDRSMNIGVVEIIPNEETQEEQLRFITFSRVSKPELFSTYPREFTAIAERTGATVTIEGTVPIWKPNLQSPLPQQMQHIYQRIFGEEAALEIAPGGLEVAVFDERWPHIEKGANGTTIVDAHKAGERVEVGSVAECYIFDLALMSEWSKQLVAEHKTQTRRAA